MLTADTVNKQEYFEEYYSLPKHIRNEKTALCFSPFWLIFCVAASIIQLTCRRYNETGARCPLSTLRWNEWNMTAVQTGCSPGPGPTSEKLIGNLRFHLQQRAEITHIENRFTHTHTRTHHRSIYWHVLSVTANLAWQSSVWLSVWLSSIYLRTLKLNCIHDLFTHANKMTCSADAGIWRLALLLLW